MLRDHKLPEDVVSVEPSCIDVVGALNARLRREGDPRRLDGQQRRVRVLGSVHGLLGGEVVEVGQRGRKRSYQLEET